MTASAGDLLDARVRALVALYRDIVATRMQGLPLLNPTLQVQAVGFEVVAAPAATAARGADGAGCQMSPEPVRVPAPAAAAVNGRADALQPAADGMAAAPVPAAGVGVLITPWFMNLVWLPLQRLEAAEQVGKKVSRHVGHECFEFIGADEHGFGAYGACSLFSPVFEFHSQQAAVDTARAVLDTLRQPVPAAQAAQDAPAAHDKVQARAATPVAMPTPTPQVPARRAFLFGRSAAAGQAARPAVQPHDISGRG